MTTAPPNEHGESAEKDVSLWRRVGAFLDELMEDGFAGLPVVLIFGLAFVLPIWCLW